MTTQNEATAQQETPAPALPIKLEGAAFEALKAKNEAYENARSEAIAAISAYGEALKRDLDAHRDEILAELRAQNGLPEGYPIDIDGKYESIGLFFIRDGRSAKGIISDLVDSLVRGETKAA